MRCAVAVTDRRPGRRTGLAVALPFLLGVAACGDAAIAPAPAATAVPTPPPASPPLPPTELRFGGFSAAREALQTRVLPAFAQAWNRTQPRPVAVRTRFAGNEALVDSLDADFPADVVVLASPRDLDALTANGLLSGDWRARPYGGIVCRSLVVMAVRKGNPKHIHNWADLARPGVRIVSPDPASSGGGVWNVCALFGAALRGHAGVPAGDADAARDFVARVAANVVARGANAHDSFLGFLDGKGDVAITYECELAQAWMFGHDVERVLPTSTVLIESPAVLLDRNVDRHGTREAAQALLDHLWTREAQQLLANCGLRPVDPAVTAGRSVQFPLPQDLWTIDQLGGWTRLTEQIQSLLTADAPGAGPGK